MFRDYAFGIILGTCLLAGVCTGLIVGATRMPAGVTVADAAGRMAMVQELGPGARGSPKLPVVAAAR
jgi:hypothetical protein